MYFDDDDDIEIRHIFTKEQQKLLKRMGVPYSAILPIKSKVDLERRTVVIESSLYRTKVRRVSINKQIQRFIEYHNNPVRGNQLMAISSFPTDLRAKNVALAIFSNAVRQYYEKRKTSRTISKQVPPMWHNIGGGFKDVLLDTDIKPSFLVLANVFEDSTPLKVEKLRDILVKHDDIPRIVVTAQVDPVSFMLGKLKHHCNSFLYIGPDDKFDD